MQAKISGDNSASKDLIETPLKDPVVPSGFKAVSTRKSVKTNTGVQANIYDHQDINSASAESIDLDNLDTQEHQDSLKRTQDRMDRLRTLMANFVKQPTD